MKNIKDWDRLEHQHHLRIGLPRTSELNRRKTREKQVKWLESAVFIQKMSLQIPRCSPHRGGRAAHFPSQAIHTSSSFSSTSGPGTVILAFKDGDHGLGLVRIGSLLQTAYGPHSISHQVNMGGGSYSWSTSISRFLPESSITSVSSGVHEI